jgi:rhodanese-related sulfurtransferase
VNYLLDNWIWIVTALVSGGLLLRPALAGVTSAGALAVTEAVRLMNREKAVVIDVSEPDEYAAGHINHARNIPLAQLETSKDVPSNKSLPILAVCASGKRAATAAAVLRKRGHAQVHVIAGGLNGWREAGLPVVRGAAAHG